MDLHWERKTTQPEVVTLTLPQARACQVGLEVLARTTSGGRRIKLAGVMFNTAMGIADSRREANQAVQNALARGV